MFNTCTRNNIVVCSGWEETRGITHENHHQAKRNQIGNRVSALTIIGFGIPAELLVDLPVESSAKLVQLQLQLDPFGEDHVELLEQ